MPSNDDTLFSRYVVKTASEDKASYVPLSHPLAENSRLFLLPLSDRVGMSRIGLSLARIPPGKDGFLPHAHAGQEEFLYIISGLGVLTINDSRTEVSAGDLVGFPTDGAAHHLCNDSDTDLVYLMGGERTAADVVSFPTIGKKGFWANGAMHFVDDENVQSLAPEDFVSRLPD